MGDYLIMSKKELKRKTLLEAHKHGKLSLIECAQRLELSYRQIKRVWARYLEEEDQGLCHRNRGKKPHNTYSLSFRSSVIEQYEKKYLDFGPTFAAEKLLEDDGLVINKETLRLWLREAGLWVKKRKIVIYRERRQRRACFGELLQIDGSIHHWFGDERQDCLLNMVDDATGITFALLDTGETTRILLTCLKRWIELYGIPQAVYVDLKNVYVGHPRLREAEDDFEGFSVFEQACKALDIRIIKAYSPQAKGRVERKHGVFQDRFVKSLKLYRINNLNAANSYLEKKFLPEINKKFACSPREKQNAHRSPKSYGNLDQILCWCYQRKLRNDWSVVLEKEYFQVHEPQQKNGLQPSMMITIKKHLDGHLEFWHNNQRLDYHPLSRKPEPPSKSKKYYVPKGPENPILQSRRATEHHRKHGHPWKQFCSNTKTQTAQLKNKHSLQTTTEIP